MTKQAAIYARVSTSDQADRGESLPSQVEACQAHAARLGYTVAQVLQEDVSGGTRFVERPAGQRLDAMIASGEIGAVIMYAVDRFSRRTGDAIMTAEDWLERGAELHFLDVGRLEDANDIVFVIKGWQGTDEKKKIRERTMRGRRHAIEGGRVVGNGSAPYGYRLTGKKKDTRLVIDEPEAATVRHVFEWFTRGDGGDPLGVTEIAGLLTLAGQGAPKGGRWTSSTLYGILRRETYAGVWYGYRQQSTKRGRRDCRQRRPKADWVGVPCTAIIDRATWQAAQARLDGGRHVGRQTAKYDYLLAGRLLCSCGYHANGTPNWSHGKLFTYYRCNNSVSRGGVARRCDMPYFRVPTWDGIVWDFVHELLLRPEKLLKGLRAEQGRRRAAAARIEAAHARATAKVAKYDTEIENLGRMLYKGQCTEAFHDREKALIERQRADVLAEQAKLAGDLAGATLTDAHIETIEQFTAEAAQGLDTATFADKRHYLDWLDVSARLAVEDGERVMYARVKVMGQREHRLCEVSERRSTYGALAEALFINVRLTAAGIQLLGAQIAV